MKYHNFSQDEVIGLNIQFIMLLDMARDEAKIPFIITSGFRTQEENTRVHGVSNSAHLLGIAADLKCNESDKRYKIITALLKVGMHRIGIYKEHIHVDMSATQPQNVIWFDEGE